MVSTRGFVVSVRILALLFVFPSWAPANPPQDTLLPCKHVDRTLFPKAYGVLANEPLYFPVDLSDWPVKIDSSRQLFLDDYLIAATTNIEREVHRPVKHQANPLLKADKPWEGGSTHFHMVRRDEKTGKFRMWYAAYTRYKLPDGTPVRFPACYAESKDGIAWEKPELGLYELNGSKANNIIIPAGNLWGLIDSADEERSEKGVGSEKGIGSLLPERPGGCFAQKTPDPFFAQQRYQGIVWHEPPYVAREGYFLYTSPDGIHWERARQEPLALSLIDYKMPQSGIGDTSMFRWDRRLKKFVGDVKFVLPGRFRCRGMMESDDLIHWTPPRMTLYPDTLDEPDSEVYGHTSFCYESMWIGFMRMMHMNRTGWKQTTVELTASRDGRHWTRVGKREEFLPLGGPDDWDADYHDPLSEPIRVGDQLWIYYRSVNRHPQRKLDIGHALGLATLRRDGFVSLNAGATAGTVTTRPLSFEGRRLFVNAEVQDGGWIKTSLLSADPGAPGSPKYSLDEAVPLRTGDVTLPVTWQGAAEVDPAEQGHLRLQFQLQAAKLYAFWVE